MEEFCEHSAASLSAAVPDETDTRCFGLLGQKLSHSYSPRIHALLSDVPYRLFEVEPQGLEEFLRRDNSWRGLNVTIPYKVDVLSYVDEQSAAVQRVGAANTLVRRADGSIYADNTDLYGISWIIKEFCQASFASEHAPSHPSGTGPKALVLGTGGASRAVSCALEDFGFVPQLISRTGSETYATLAQRHADAILLINTTPVGMYPNCPASPLSSEQLASLTNLKGLIDIVYNPRNTALLEQARELHIPFTSGGMPMLVAQAFRSSELFQDCALNDALIPQLVEDISREMTNIVLIGMPGAGKTSSGKRLARLAGRPFIDLDVAVEIACDMSPAHYITKYGEDAFRELETTEVARYGKESGLVIACGGGVVVRPENYEHLHQNGLIVMIDRPLNALSTRNRPVTTAKGIERLAQERMHLYREWADYILVCAGSADEDAARLKEKFGL